VLISTFLSAANYYQTLRTHMLNCHFIMRCENYKPLIINTECCAFQYIVLNSQNFYPNNMEKRKRCARQKAPQDGKKRLKRNIDPLEQANMRSDTDQYSANRNDQDAQSSSCSLTNGTNFTHPFPVDPFDQCETPLQAYREIEPLLSLLASRLKIEKQDLLIFDPYFCHGSVIRHLGSLGFTSVYNRNEDFYSSIANHTIPPYHILVLLSSSRSLSNNNNFNGR